MLPLGCTGHFMRSMQSIDVNNVNTSFFECSIIVKSDLGHVVSGMSNRDFPMLSTVWTTTYFNYTTTLIPPSKWNKVLPKKFRRKM